MYESDDRIVKWEIEVELTFASGQRVLGHLFVRPKQRLSDLLNDDREFLPFRYSDGRVEMVRKDSIAGAMPLHVEVTSDAVGDPYAFLGVPRNIDDEALREAYLDLCKQNHPDRLQSLGAAPDIIDYANARLRRVIDAYRRIMIERHGAAVDGEEAGPEAPDDTSDEPEDPQKASGSEG